MKVTNLPAMPAGMEFQDLASLDEGMVQALTRHTREAEVSKRGQVKRLDEAISVTDPEKLHAMQVEMAEYSVKISLANALVRKAVSTVETLVKS